jgi:hypothetical protein
MIENIEIKSVISFLNEINKRGHLAMFRGQGNDWPLLPTIGRMAQYINPNPKKKDLKHGIPFFYVKWNYLEEDLINKFKKYSIPFLKRIPTSKVEWLILAQHHGLPTRFLDWSTNPLKGLYFAVENSNHATDGVVWAFTPNGYYEDLSKIYEMTKGEIGSLVAYFPDHLNARIIAQESCFTYFPFPKKSIPMPPLENIKKYSSDIKKLYKFTIPLKYKKTIKKELNKYGISHRSLFPDLDGISTAIRREYEISW